jgi:hypothetical protein
MTAIREIPKKKPQLPRLRRRGKNFPKKRRIKEVRRLRLLAPVTKRSKKKKPIRKLCVPLLNLRLKLLQYGNLEEEEYSTHPVNDPGDWKKSITEMVLQKMSLEKTISKTHGNRYHNLRSELLNEEQNLGALLVLNRR